LKISQGHKPVSFYFFGVAHQPSMISVAPPGESISVNASKTVAPTNFTKKSDLKTLTLKSTQYKSDMNNTSFDLADLSILDEEKADHETTDCDYLSRS